MSDENKAPMDPLAVFSNLPDVRGRIKQAGIVVRLREQEVALEQAEDRLLEFEEQRARDRMQHERELTLVTQAVRGVTAAPCPAGTSRPAAAPAPTVASDLISSYVESYFDNLPAEQRPKGKTLEQYRAKSRRLSRLWATSHYCSSAGRTRTDLRT
jgi:hypothetical protein